MWRCLPLDILSQVAVQDSGGCEETGLWQRNEQLTTLIRGTETDKWKDCNPQKRQEKNKRQKRKNDKPIKQKEELNYCMIGQT